MERIITFILDMRDRTISLIESILGQLSLAAMGDMDIIDVMEILIIAVCIYRLILWVRDTKAWMLLKGIIVIIMFIVLASLFQMTTILYLAMISVNVLAVAMVVVFQPEIRRALENIGQSNLLSTIVTFDKKKENARFSLDTLKSLVEASGSMSKVKTGALIVIEKEVRLSEYESTGIEMDCVVSYQTLLNIFEHNTPLHDGAVIIRGDRIASATCYLPLSDNMNLSKDLGTRHRAAVGISEVSDALVIVVSEETGNISIASKGDISVDLDRETLESRLEQIRVDAEQVVKQIPFNKLFTKGGLKNESNKTNNPS